MQQNGLKIVVSDMKLQNTIAIILSHTTKHPTKQQQI